MHKFASLVISGSMVSSVIMQLDTHASSLDSADVINETHWLQVRRFRNPKAHESAKGTRLYFKLLDGDARGRGKQSVNPTPGVSCGQTADIPKKKQGTERWQTGNRLSH